MLRETKFLCNKTQVNPNSYQMIKWADCYHSLFPDPYCCKFLLNPVLDGKENEFYIEMTYGDTPPRLVSYDGDIRLKSYLACTNKSSMGYNDKSRSVWTINIA